MNDQEFEAQTERIRVLAERWAKPLGLGWWHVRLKFERDSDEFAERTKATGAATTLAVCTADWRYMEATITWNMRLVAAQDDDELERDVLHELMHVFLKEISVDDPNHRASEERVATTLAKAFIWIRDFVQDGEPPAFKRLSEPVPDMGPEGG